MPLKPVFQPGKGPRPFKCDRRYFLKLANTAATVSLALDTSVMPLNEQLKRVQEVPE
jgi:hypothetical protein